MKLTIESKKTRLPLLFILALGSWPSVCWPAIYSSRYDDQIERAAREWLPQATVVFEWRILKAQYYQESRLNPDARSPVGAAGIAQFMPGTWRDVSRQMNYGTVSPHMTGYAIPAGAYYMAKLRRRWLAKRTEYDRHSLAMASYNAGPGNIARSQRRAADKITWAGVSSELHKVTGHYATETRTYVVRIWRWWQQMRNGM